MHDLWHLQRQEFFANLEPQKQRFLAHAQRREYKKNGIVFFEGERGDSCFYLKSGLVRIFSISESGKEPVFFLRRPGEMFGLSEVLNDYPRKTNAQAITPAEIYSMNGSEFDKVLAGDYALARRVITVLGSRLRQLSENISDLVSCSVMERLIKLLIALGYEQLPDAGAWNSPVRIALRISQGQIAAMIGSTQPTVSDLLQELQEDDLVSVSNRQITLRDPSGLLAKAARLKT
ncbi:MAG: Crp/Fnr family transcriptional regulator [Desulfovibrio sp.]|jgi:CRP-like cAMP-binding protein|nr:Crp/Fnr family transcriptional regulator [Desulfovibrio sp.]